MTPAFESPTRTRSPTLNKIPVSTSFKDSCVFSLVKAGRSGSLFEEPESCLFKFVDNTSLLATGVCGGRPARPILFSFVCEPPCLVRGVLIFEPLPREGRPPLFSSFSGSPIEDLFVSGCRKPLLCGVSLEVTPGGLIPLRGAGIPSAFVVPGGFTILLAGAFSREDTGKLLIFKNTTTRFFLFLVQN